MKKKLFLATALFLIFALVAVVIGVRIWFASAGVQVLGDDLHVELSGKCYIIDPESMEIKDETTLYLDGSTGYFDGSVFEGELKVLGYQNTAKGTIDSTMAVERGENGYWIIHHFETCTHQETVDGITKPMEHFCDYQYIYYINPDLDDQIIVRIEPFGKDPLYAVQADSQEQALSRYQAFSADHP